MKLPPQLPRVSEDDKKVLGEFLANKPLYVPVTVPGIRLDGDTPEKILPAEIQMFCASPKCRGFESQWRLEAAIEGAMPGCVTVRYRCRNCGSDSGMWLRWQHEYSEETEARRAGTKVVNEILSRVGAVPIGDYEPPKGAFRFEKIGQVPPLAVNIPPDLGEALGEQHAHLYRKAIVCRNQGYGIGALAYFRRVLEETMDGMLDLLAAALREDGAASEITQRVEDAKREHVFERKAEVAAHALPENLRPGGFNPFGSLHDLYSKGVHGLSDGECVEIVDQMRKEMDITFKTLKTHVTDLKAYKEAARRLEAQQRPKRSK